MKVSKRGEYGMRAPMASAAELKRLMQSNTGQPGVYAILIDVRDAVSSILDRTSLADVLRRNRQARETKEE